MRYFSTFSGVEGIGQGLGGECVGFSEIDKYASMVLKYRFPNVKNYGDITKINWSEIPDFDVLVGGSPCQDFSIAGKRTGLGGARSSLAWEFIRGLRSKQPAYFIWENVEGVMSSRGGWDFANLLCAFSESGYDLWWQVLNAKDFGVAQSRSRIIVVGFRGGSPREILFEAKGSRKDIECFAYDVSGKGYNSQQDRLYFVGGVAPTIPSTRTENKLNVFVDLQLEGKPQITQNARTIQARYYKGYSLRYGENSGILTVPLRYLDRNQKNYQGEYFNTIDTSNTNGIMKEGKIRRLTPIECERLMSWPDDWTRWGINEKGEKVEISDSQRYKMCGNGVVSNVIKELKFLITPLKGEKGRR